VSGAIQRIHFPPCTITSDLTSVFRNEGDVVRPTAGPTGPPQDGNIHSGTPNELQNEKGELKELRGNLQSVDNQFKRLLQKNKETVLKNQILEGEVLRLLGELRTRDMELGKVREGIQGMEADFRRWGKELKTVEERNQKFHDEEQQKFEAVRKEIVGVVERFGGLGGELKIAKEINQEFDDKERGKLEKVRTDVEAVAGRFKTLGKELDASKGRNQEFHDEAQRKLDTLIKKEDVRQQ